MPLSPAAPRELIHNRNVECRGYERADGLWDVEGYLVDTKTYDFSNRFRGDMTAGTPVHGMWLRITVDDDLLIHAAEAVTDHGPYPTCPAITHRFKELEGLRIGPGFARAVRERLGGVQGCTHLVELVRPVATTAFQTIVPRRRRIEEQDDTQRPPFLNSCHAFSEAGMVVKELWPRWYTGDDD